MGEVSTVPGHILRPRRRSHREQQILTQRKGSETSRFPDLGNWYLLGRAGARAEGERDLGVIFEKARTTITGIQSCLRK